MNRTASTNLSLHFRNLKSHFIGLSDGRVALFHSMISSLPPLLTFSGYRFCRNDPLACEATTIPRSLSFSACGGAEGSSRFAGMSLPYVTVELLPEKLAALLYVSYSFLQVRSSYITQPSPKRSLSIPLFLPNSFSARG